MTTAPPRVALLDYDAGNLPSARRGLERAGAVVSVVTTGATSPDVDALVVPGVGHVGACLQQLRARGLDELITTWVADERPLLGICVGMQLLYEHSDEGDARGLGLLPGSVTRLPSDVRVPHMGWDVLDAVPGHEDDPVAAAVVGERAYFVHSYAASGTDAAIATCTYGRRFAAIVRAGSVVATQFHPEKSGALGRRLLRAWLAEVSLGTRTPTPC